MFGRAKETDVTPPENTDVVVKRFFKRLPTILALATVLTGYSVYSVAMPIYHKFTHKADFGQVLDTAGDGGASVVEPPKKATQLAIEGGPQHAREHTHDGLDREKLKALIENGH